MRGAGGKVSGGAWTTRVKALRPGDCIRATHWSGEIWCGGEIWEVMCAAHDGGGYWNIWCFDPEAPDNERMFVILADDEVMLAARNADGPPKTIVQPKKTGRSPKPKRGEQLKLL